jgi:hypothetical protein
MLIDGFEQHESSVDVDLLRASFPSPLGQMYARNFRCATLLHMTDHAIPKLYAGCERTRKAGYSLVVKIDENYSIQSMQNPLFIRLGLERRIWMKRYSFGLPVLALILKNKRVGNNG